MAFDFRVLVVVNDFDFVRIAIPPFKTNPPLIVNPNAVLSLAITSQLFQSIARRSTQIDETFRGVEEQEFSVCRPL